MYVAHSSNPRGKTRSYLQTYSPISAICTSELAVCCSYFASADRPQPFDAGTISCVAKDRRFHLPLAK